MQNTEGDMTTKVSDPHYRLSVDDFKSDVAPHLTSADTIVLVYAEGQPTNNLVQLVEELSIKVPDLSFVLLTWSIKDHHGNLNGITTVRTAVSKASTTSPLLCHFTIPYFQLLNDFPVLLEMSVKWVLNSISLGAHILKVCRSATSACVSQAVTSMVYGSNHSVHGN
jgi:hypothetical protein